jgi:hypothetical protein
LYDPEEAATAMLAGRVLLNHLKEKCLCKKWENGRASFCKEDGMGGYSDLFDLSGLYEGPGMSKERIILTDGVIDISGPYIRYTQKEPEEKNLPCLLYSTAE